MNTMRFVYSKLPDEDYMRIVVNMKNTNDSDNNCESYHLQAQLHFELDMIAFNQSTNGLCHINLNFKKPENNLV